MTEAASEKISSEMCAFCSAPNVKVVYKTKLFGKGEKAVVIENVPLRHCGTCGETYYTPETSQLIDELLAHPEKQKITRQVNVVSLAA
jgi:YgiT-type zinc finger domain-containing protein